MKRPTPPKSLTAAFHEAGLSWYLHGDQAPDHVLRICDGGPACWLAQFDPLERPCAGRLEVIHLISRQRIRNVLSPLLLGATFDESFETVDLRLTTELVQLAEWDPRIAAPGCTGHHRRVDSQATPELVIPFDGLRVEAVEFIEERGLESEADRRFAPPLPSEAGTAAGLQQPPLAGAGADTRESGVLGRTRLRDCPGQDVSAGSGESGHSQSASSAGEPDLPGPAGFPHGARPCTGTAPPEPDMEANR